MLPSGAGPISSISISKTSALSKQKPSVSFFCLQCLLASMRNAKSVLGFKPPVWLSPLLPWHPAKTIMSLARNDSARQGQYTSSRQGYCAFQDVKAMKAKAGFGKDMQRLSWHKIFYKLYVLPTNHSSWWWRCWDLFVGVHVPNKPQLLSSVTEWFIWRDCFPNKVGQGVKLVKLRCQPATFTQAESWIHFAAASTPVACSQHLLSIPAGSTLVESLPRETMRNSCTEVFKLRLSAFPLPALAYMQDKNASCRTCPTENDKEMSWIVTVVTTLVQNLSQSTRKRREDTHGESSWTYATRRFKVIQPIFRITEDFQSESSLDFERTMTYNHTSDMFLACRPE